MRPKITVGDVALTREAKRNVNLVLNSNRLSYGSFSRNFENRFARMHGASYGVLTNSGTSSLHIAYLALKEKFGWKDGDEVIVPATTFIATSNMLIQSKLKPILVDVRPDSYTIDPSLIEASITENTRAIVPVHLLGLPCDMAEIMAISSRRKLRVVEDSAECFMAQYRGRKVGSFGDIGVFSFYIAHYIVTGVGGIDVTSDPKLAVMLRSLANHGRDSIYLGIDDDDFVSGQQLREVISRRFKFVRLGFSYRITEMEAAIGVAALDRAAAIVRRRREIAQRYIKGLSGLAEHIQFPHRPKDRDNNFMMFGLVLRDEPKTGLVGYLEDNGIETRDIPSLLNQPVYGRAFGNLNRKFPVSSWISKSGFYIGCHEHISNKSVDYVIDTFHKYFRK